METWLWLSWQSSASDTRDLCFESSNQLNLISINCIGKTNMKKKEAGKSQFASKIMYSQKGKNRH